MVFRKIFFVVGFFTAFNSFAQKLKIEKTLPFAASFFTVDKLGHLYAVSNGNVIQTDTNGTILHSFSNKSIGNVNFIDASNPLRIMVYVRDFSVIYFLDNQLAIQSSINLRDQFLTDAWPVCNSNNEGFWIFDRNQNILQKYDYTLKSISQSQPLNLLVSDELKPMMMGENDKWLVLQNENTGFMVFDRLGSYDRTLRDSVVQSFFLSEKNLIYFSGNNLVFTSLETGLEFKRIPLDVKKVDNVRWFNNCIYLLSENKIQVYSIAD